MSDIPPKQIQYNLNTVFAGGIFLLLALILLHEASSIAIPIIIAFILKLVFQPVLRLLRKWKVPRSLGAAIIFLALVIGIAGLTMVLATPAMEWARKLPDSFPQLQQRLTFLTKPVEKTEKILIQADSLAQSPGQKVFAVELPGMRLSDKIVADTQLVIRGVFTTLIIFFFLLASDDIFLRRLVDILPTFHDKRLVIDIGQQIEHDISRYLLTITTMSAGVGIATGIVLKIYHIPNPLLWGTLVFLLNYIPIVGSFVAAGILALVGLMSANTIWVAFTPALAYGVIHLAESLLITPLLLAKRFTLNPLFLILSLIFWYWMWGLAGAILAMPMLTITKIICDRIERLAPLGHLLEGA